MEKQTSTFEISAWMLEKINSTFSCFFAMKACSSFALSCYRKHSHYKDKHARTLPFSLTEHMKFCCMYGWHVGSSWHTLLSGSMRLMMSPLVVFVPYIRTRAHTHTSKMRDEDEVWTCRLKMSLWGNWCPLFRYTHAWLNDPRNRNHNRVPSKTVAVAVTVTVAVSVTVSVPANLSHLFSCWERSWRGKTRAFQVEESNH